MKNNMFWAGLVLFLVFSTNIDAQFNAGIIGGVNIATFDAENDEISSRVLWGAGFILSYDLNENFSLQTEPMYLKKGGIREQQDDDPKLTLSQDYIEIPILLNFGYGEKSKFHLVAGPTFGFTISSELEADISGIMFEADIIDLTESIDVGLCFGGGFSTEISPGSLFLEVKYNMGLTNLSKTGTFTAKAGALEIQGDLDEDESEYKSRGIQILVGYKIPI